MEDRIRDAIVELADEWTGLLAPGDAARLREFGAEKRLTAARRLATLRLWVDGNPAIPSADAAVAAARLSRSRFFALAKAIRRDGVVRLDDLGLYLKRAPRDGGPRSDAIVEAASEMLAVNPGIGTADLVGALRPAAGGATRMTIHRAIDRARRTAPATAPFGAFMMFDTAGLDLVDAQGARQRLFALLDLGTGLIPAWTLRSEADFAEAYREVARLANGPKRWDGEAPPLLDAVDVGASELLVAAPVEVDARFRREVAGRGVRIVTDHRRIGRRLVAALGGGVGGLVVRAGFTAPGADRRDPLRKDPARAGPVALERIRRGLADQRAERLRLLAKGDGDVDSLVAAAARRLVG